METKRGVYEVNTVSTEANQLETVLRARGIDPSDVQAWPIWDQWQQHGLNAALDYLQGGTPTMPLKKKKPPTLAELYETFCTLRNELHEIEQKFITAGDAYKTAQHDLRTASDTRTAQIARAELLIAKNQGDALSIERQRVGGLLHKAEVAWRNANNAVAIARTNLQRLAGPQPVGGNYIKHAPGDIRQLQRENQAILEKYGVSEQEETSHE